MREFVSGVKLSTRGVEVLMFADDMVLMAESAEGLEKNLGVMNEALRRWELKVNWKKTKVMRVARQKGACEVRIGDQAVGSGGHATFFSKRADSTGGHDGQYLISKPPLLVYNNIP